MHVSEKGVDSGSDEESIHMPVGPRNSVLVTCPPCLCLRLLVVRFLRCVTTAVSVIRFLATQGCENFDALCTISLRAANLGSRDVQSEDSVLRSERSR